ncbi:MAG: hypothetical protein II776_05405 [Clostridia bacterium]|nr:hypothetical protein [Clostridia bacterium]
MGKKGASAGFSSGRRLFFTCTPPFALSGGVAKYDLLFYHTEDDFSSLFPKKVIRHFFPKGSAPFSQKLPRPPVP